MFTIIEMFQYFMIMKTTASALVIKMFHRLEEHIFKPHSIVRSPTRLTPPSPPHENTNMDGWAAGTVSYTLRDDGQKEKAVLLMAKGCHL